MHRIIAIAEKRFSSESTMEALWSIIYITLYQHYDMTKEFFPQFIENRDELIKTLKLAPGLNLGGKKDGK